jgi:hypothetical protein
MDSAIPVDSNGSDVEAIASPCVCIVLSAKGRRHNGRTPLLLFRHLSDERKNTRRRSASYTRLEDNARLRRNVRGKVGKP